MEDVSLSIYEPDPNKPLSNNIWVYGLWFVVLTLFWVFNGTIDKHGLFMQCFTLLLFVGGIATFGLVFFSGWMYEPLNGHLDGTVIFKDHEVVVSDKIVDFKTLSVIDLDLIDFYGKKRIAMRSDLNPKRSQGVGNSITLTDNNGQTQTIYFQLLTEHHYVDLAPFINTAIKANKMTFKRGIDIIGIENVSI